MNAITETELESTLGDIENPTPSLSPFAQEDEQVHRLVDTQTRAWDIGTQRSHYLLTGRELERATEWADREDAYPEANLEHKQFIEASAKLKNRRLYRIIGIIGGFFLAVILGRELAHLIIPLDNPTQEPPLLSH